MGMVCHVVVPPFSFASRFVAAIGREVVIPVLSLVASVPVKTASCFPREDSALWSVVSVASAPALPSCRGLWMSGRTVVPEKIYINNFCFSQEWQRRQVFYGLRTQTPTSGKFGNVCKSDAQENACGV